jgi:hypothetical protein
MGRTLNVMKDINTVTQNIKFAFNIDKPDQYEFLDSLKLTDHLIHHNNNVDAPILILQHFPPLSEAFWSNRNNTQYNVLQNPDGQYILEILNRCNIIDTLNMNYLAVNLLPFVPKYSSPSLSLEEYDIFISFFKYYLFKKPPKVLFILGYDLFKILSKDQNFDHLDFVDAFKEFYNFSYCKVDTFVLPTEQDKHLMSSQYLHFLQQETNILIKA